MMLPTLLRASIEGALLVLLVWVVTRTVRSLSPAARTVIWWAAGAKFLIALFWIAPIALPVLPASVRDAAVERPGRIVAVTSAERAAAAPPAPAGPRSWMAGISLDWQSSVAVLWLGGIAVAAAFASRQWRQTRAAIARATPAGDHTLRMTTALARQLGLRRTPAVKLSADVDTPLVAGLLEPVVLLPAARYVALDEHQQRMALCHELAHVKRNDLWLGCVPALAERLFFFHPLVHVAAREYALAREAACDAAVIRAIGSTPQEYGRLLLHLGISRRPGAFVAAGTPWSFGTLKRRIAMLDHMSTRSAASRFVASVVVGLSLAALVPIELTARPQAPVRTGIAGARDLRSSANPASRSGDRLQRDVAPREEPAQRRRDGLNYVLFLDDDNTTMSGSTGDVGSARTFKQPGEPLLWFRRDGREYVIRAPETLGRIMDLWAEVRAIGHEQGIVGGKQGEIGRLQGEIGAKQAEVGIEQGKIGVRQARIGDRQSRLAAEESHRPLSQTRQQTIDRERRDLDQDMRALDDEMRVLDRRMQDLDRPMRELDEKMRVLDREMQFLDGKMKAATDKAESAMRGLLEQAIASGVAQPAR